ncbi:dual specificity protein phosphatase 22-A-like isoform X3 [Accipiter gentilis]|uniref:dual specificity protein phosphatase 22-A-like isoform X3 n=1 Tax=Astur gentilis TaxID=8957 RepID=UPI00210F36B1|nr:dual specificity protein phosphatase 22-A-like isoform X3 [Accipiter gentilis]
MQLDAPATSDARCAQRRLKSLSFFVTSQVVKGLYLGNIRDSEDRENLLKNGVTHILSIHNSAKPVLEDMTYLCISASDSSSQNLLQHFKECIRFIHECRLGGGGCLVHCLAGVSRSTTVLVAYLMTVTELGWESCLAATKAVRSYVSPNFGFQQQLQEYEATLLQEAASVQQLWSVLLSEGVDLGNPDIPGGNPLCPS